MQLRTTAAGPQVVLQRQSEQLTTGRPPTDKPSPGWGQRTPCFFSMTSMWCRRGPRIRSVTSTICWPKKEPPRPWMTLSRASTLGVTLLGSPPFWLLWKASQMSSTSLHSQPCTCHCVQLCGQHALHTMTMIWPSLTTAAAGDLDCTALLCRVQCTGRPSELLQQAGIGRQGGGAAYAPLVSLGESPFPVLPMEGSTYFFSKKLMTSVRPAATTATRSYWGSCMELCSSLLG